MSIFLLSLVICYILFLYFLYKLGREDFILTRKNVALEHLFNLTFITTFVAIFFGRFFYVLFHFDRTFLNPLKFFIIPYFPGILLPGAVSGAFFYLWFLYKKKRSPSARLIDFYSLALLFIMPYLMLSQVLLFSQHFFLTQVILAFVYFVVFLLFNFILLPKVSKGEIKGGTIGLIFLSILCTNSFLQDSFLNSGRYIYFLRGEDIFYLFVLIISIVLIVYREFIPTSKKK